MNSRTKWPSTPKDARTRWTYGDAVKWIAENDNPGGETALDVDMVHGYVTVGFVSDVFEVDQRVVATDVVRVRATGRL